MKCEERGKERGGFRKEGVRVRYENEKEKKGKRIGEKERKGDRGKQEKGNRKNGI